VAPSQLPDCFRLGRIPHHLPPPVVVLFFHQDVAYVSHTLLPLLGGFDSTLHILYKEDISRHQFSQLAGQSYLFGDHSLLAVVHLSLDPNSIRYNIFPYVCVVLAFPLINARASNLQVG
jgi:hypothetical protein